MPISIRASSLQGYTDCPRRAFASAYSELVQEDFELRQSKTGVYAPLGTAVHKGCETLCTDKIYHNGVQIKTAVESANEEFFAEIDKSESGIFWDDTTPNISTALTQINRLVQNFRNAILDKLEFPENAEPSECLELSLKTPLSNDFELTGHVDILTQNGIVDLKTGQRIGNHTAQLGAYAILISPNMTKVKSNYSLSTVNIPRSKLNKKINITETRYDLRHSLLEAGYIVKDVMRIYTDYTKTRSPYVIRANPSSMLCSKKFCRAFGTAFCKYKSKEVK